MVGSWLPTCDFGYGGRAKQSTLREKGRAGAQGTCERRARQVARLGLYGHWPFDNVVMRSHGLI